MPSMSPNDKVENIEFQGAKWFSPRRKIKKVTFKNISVSNMELFQITFNDCTFVDCIFIASRFREVEFHNCKFINCNMWKAKFEQCYLDPQAIQLDRSYRVSAANVGVSVYQALLSNYANERQDVFFAYADIEFRRWKRYQLKWDIKAKRIDRLSGEWRRFCNLVYDLGAGYGYKPLRLFIVTILGFMIIAILNHYFIGSDLLINQERPDRVTFVDSLYYTFSVLTVLGFSTVVPDGACAKLLTVFEALVAIGWLSILTSVIVKRVLR